MFFLARFLALFLAFFLRFFLTLQSRRSIFL